MNKIFIILGLIVTLSACTLGQKNPSTEKTQTTEGMPTEVSQVKESTYEQDLKEASSKIKDSEEFKSCMDMNVPMCIQNAGMQLAQKSQSTEFCDELTTPEQKESCVFAVTILKIQQSNDKKLCDGLNGIYKEQCIKTAVRGEAMAKKDAKICASLVKNTNTGELMGMEDTSSDECIMGVVMSSPESTIKSCDAIVSAQIKEMCTMTLRDREEMRKIENNTQN